MEGLTQPTQHSCRVLSLPRCVTVESARPPPPPVPRHGDAEAAIFHDALLTSVYPDILACSVQFTDRSNQLRKALQKDQTNAAGPTRPTLLYLLMLMFVAVAAQDCSSAAWLSIHRRQRPL